MKVIHIMGNSPSLHIKDIYDTVHYGWTMRVAQEIKKRSNIELECWFFERTKNEYEELSYDGIKCRIFPCTFSLGFGHEYSKEMLDFLKKQSEAEDFILHLHTVYSFNNYMICKKFSKIPIVLQQHGEVPPTKLVEMNRKFTALYPLLMFEQMLEKNVLKNIKQFFVLSEREKRYLQNFVNADVKIQQMGVDFNMFKSMNKAKARRKLGWDMNKKIILHVGRFYKIKGLHFLLDCFKQLSDDYELVVVGGYKDDVLYNELAETKGVRTIERINYPKSLKLIPLLYSASDVFVLPGESFHDRWAGVDIPIIESLACETPVIAHSLKKFPSNEQNKLGIPLESKSMLLDSINKFFTEKKKYSCRETAKKYYSWDVIAKNTINVYKSLYNMYL